MKVLHAAETVKGGVATIIDELLNDQSNVYGNVDVLLPREHVEFISAGEGRTIYTFKRSGRGLLGFFNFSIFFLRLIKRNKYDVIHLHSTFAGFFGRIILFFHKSNASVIYCPHAFSFLMTGGKVKRFLFGFIERVLEKKTDSIICVSNYERNEALIEKLSPSKLKVIHNGIKKDADWVFSNVKYESDEFLNVTFIGRLDYQKGFDIFYSVIQKFLSEGSINTINFHVVGEAVNDSFVKYELESKGNVNVFMHGWISQSEIKSFYKMSHLIVMPSRWEGFGLVVTESFQYGTPVIASDNTSLKELIDDGFNGYLFETGDSSALYNKIKEIDFVELKEMSLNCYRTYIDKYTSETMLEKVRLLYK